MAQRRLATLVGSSQSNLAKIEAGKIVPSYVLAGKIFSALDSEEHRADKRVSDVMHAPVITFDVAQTAADAIRAAKAEGVDQFPVLRRGHIVGCVTTRELMGVEANVPLSKIMGPALPSVPRATAVVAVRALLLDAPAVVVMDDGEIEGIVSPQDLL